MKKKLLLFQILICSIFLFTNRVYAANESNDTYLILEETHTDAPLNAPTEYNSVSTPGDNIVDATQTTSTTLMQASTTLTQTVDKYTITAAGNMPEGAELSIQRVYNTDQLEKVIGEEDYTVYAAFDIEILIDGEVWQPVEHGESVSIDITGVDIPEDQELKVYRIEDEAVETGEAISDDSVVEVESSVSENGNVVVETDHFTVYAVGGVSYDLAPVATGTWLGMTYETFDSDGDRTAETLVLSGTQTQEASSETGDSNYCGKAPYYQNNITTVSFQSGTKLISGRHLFRSCSNLETIDATNADVSNVTDFYCMFHSCSGLTSLDVSNFDTSNGTNFSYMFFKCQKLTSIDVSSFDTAKVTDFEGMFDACKALTSLDVSGFVTSSGTKFKWMFYDCQKLTSLDVSGFNTSSCTDFGGMFGGCYVLASLDVSGFNTSKGKNFDYMFNSCGALTSLDISSFDASNGVNFQYMFSNCKKLTSLNLGNFNTPQGTNFSYMFSGCSGLTSLDLSNFNTSSGTNFGYMFNSCSGLTSLNVSGFNTSSGTNFCYMFGNCSSLTSLDVSKFDTSNSTNFSFMFHDCSGLTSLDVSGFDTSKGKNFNYMFNNCTKLTSLDVSKFNTSSGTNFSYMFGSCSGLTSLNVSSFDTLNGTDFSSMFSSCSSLTSLDVSKFNTSNGTDFRWMFNNCSSLTSLDVSSFNTSKGTNFSYMFRGCSALTSLNVSSFDTSKITSSSKMFSLSDCNNLQKFSAPKTNSYGIVLPAKTGCSWYLDDIEPKLEADTKSTYRSIITPITDQSHIYIRSDIDGFCMYYDITKLRQGSTINQYLKNTADNGYTYTSHCYLRTTDTNGTDFVENTITDIVWTDSPFISEVNLAQAGYTPVYARKNGTVIELYTTADCVKLHAEASYMFTGMTGLQQVSFLTDKIETSDVKHMRAMFSGKTMRYNAYDQYVADYDSPMSLQTLDLSRFDTSQVTTMMDLFHSCRTLTTLDISNFNTANVKAMNGMFGGCACLPALDLAHFDTSNVTDMSGMFCNNTALASLDISNFNTSKVTDMSWMFQGLASLPSLDLSHFDTSNVTTMRAMFIWSSGLQTLNLNGWDTSQTTNMSGMFRSCARLTSLDLSSFNTSKVTDMNGTSSATGDGMFAECHKLQTLTLGSGFNTSKVTNMAKMFSNDSHLTAVNTTCMDTSQVTDMSEMFSNCSSLSEIDVSNFNTAQVTNMDQMFSGCLALSSLDISNFVCNQAIMTSFVKDSGIRTITLPSTLTHIDDSMFAGTVKLSLIYGANAITTISASAWTNPAQSAYPFFRYLFTHQDEVYVPVFNMFNENYDTRALLTQADIDTGNYIILSYEDMFNAMLDENFNWTPNHVLSGRTTCEMTRVVPEMASVANYLDNINASAGKQLIYIDNYQSLNASCWREHNWEADGITVMMYEVSVPALFNLDANTILNVNITKYLEDAEINLTIPNQVVLTNSLKPAAYITYHLIPDIADTTLLLNSTSVPSGVEYAANDWHNNIKTCNYFWTYQRDPDLSHASATGTYVGDCTITFAR